MHKRRLRTCPNGHQFYKSSDCPVCPVCEHERKPDTGFLSQLAVPARRALEKIGVKTLVQLSKYSECEILELHGMGPNAISKLKIILDVKNLSFRKE